MQAQAYEGYVENGRFYPQGNTIHLTGRFRAMLTILDVPTHDTSTEWVDDLEQMVEADTSVDLQAEDFPRLDFGHEPFVLIEKGEA